MTEDTPVQSPTDIAGVGIHLSYLRRDMAKMNATLENITSNYVPITVHLEMRAEMEKRLDILEKQAEARRHFEDTWSGRVWGINTTIGMVVGGILFLLNHYWTSK